MRAETDQPLLVVDAGNLLFDKALGGKEGQSNTIPLITARGLVEAYKAMRYDAVAVSASDLSAGSDFFQQTINAAFPWVAANVYANNSTLLFSPHIIKQLGSMTIGIIGLTGTDKLPVAGCSIGDWRAPLRAEVALLQERCDLLVVLSNLSEAENREIQRDFNQIDIIVAADRKRTNIQPAAAQNSLLVQSGSRGKYLGRLDITWASPGSWQAGSARKLRAGAEKPPGKSYRASFLPVRPAASNESVDAIVREIKERVAAGNKNRLTDLQAPAPAVQLAEEAMGGFTACAPCHKKQTAFWQKTNHAGAYTTLAEQGQSFNLHCLPCHVTAGRITPSSPESDLLLLLSLGPERQTIGCEVCHGPGKSHIRSSGEVAPVRLPAEQLCTRCHTSDRDSTFTYAKKVAAVACPAD